jgi:hypothetical protein
LTACSKDDPIYRTVPDVHVQEEISDPLTELQCAPNPAQAHTTVSFRLARQQKVDVCVYDMFGRTIFSENDHACLAGYNALTIDLSVWPQGVYILQVIVDKKSYSKKIVKA